MPAKILQRCRNFPTAQAIISKTIRVGTDLAPVKPGHPHCRCLAPALQTLRAGLPCCHAEGHSDEVDRCSRGCHLQQLSECGCLALLSLSQPLYWQCRKCNVQLLPQEQRDLVHSSHLYSSGGIRNSCWPPLPLEGASGCTNLRALWLQRKQRSAVGRPPFCAQSL